MITSVSEKLSVADTEYNVLATDVQGNEDGSGVLLDSDGNVAGIGTHEELLENCEVYQEIYYSQFRKEKEA